MAVIEVVTKVKPCFLLKVKLKVTPGTAQTLDQLFQTQFLNNSIFITKSAHSCRITHMQDFFHNKGH